MKKTPSSPFRARNNDALLRERQRKASPHRPRAQKRQQNKARQALREALD